LVRGAQLRTQQVPNRYWQLEDGKLIPDKKYWDRLETVFKRINPASPDQDFQSFLDQAWSLDTESAREARRYVEGFHAAPADRIGTHALALAEAAAERDKATRQFRLKEGYSALLTWLVRELSARGVEIWTNTTVTTVCWQRGRLEVSAQAPGGLREFQAERAVVTLPLGILKQEGPAAVKFVPQLNSKIEAIRALGVGAVVKLTLQFKKRIWPIKNFGFIYLDDAALPVWWSDARGPIITGWVGGPQAIALRDMGPERILAEALQILARVFNKSLHTVKESLSASYSHDWNADPFTLGPYSYTPARMTSMPARLAAPLAGTLFFAGEATDGQGEQGTVHGAIASGHRAAAEIAKSIQMSITPGMELRRKR